VARLSAERTALADKLSDAVAAAGDVGKLRAELDKLHGVSARQASLDDTLRQLQSENAQLAAEVNEKNELEHRVLELVQRNEVLERQNKETLSLLDDVRATAASLGDTFLAQAGKADSLADELAGLGSPTLPAAAVAAPAPTAAPAVDSEEAARLRDERRRQQELMQLLSQQLKMAEDSMNGKEKEADMLRRELIKREQARKSGYLYKRGQYFGWEKLFILLESEFLHYGDTPNKSFKGVVILKGARVDHSPATLAKRAHCFAIETLNRTFYFAADTEEEMVDWIVAIMAVIKDANHPSETAKAIATEAGTAGLDPRHRMRIDEKKLMAGVYENERRATPLSSFVHTSLKWQMRAPFSDKDGNDVSGAGNLLPDARRPSFENGWFVLCNNADVPRDAASGIVHIDTVEPTDEQGWEYAFSFQADEWHGECGATSFVRRRRWVTDDGLELIKVRGDPLSARRLPNRITSPAPAVIVGARPVVVSDAKTPVKSNAH
jgi:hypothetical protein